ncbi:MAG: hypothetical protein JGK24_30815 [Microcoleus sp. PH2017_29_MFU_D_A]|uniref:hypothetical protein n=1 Tax=unclassified Microcoleus TaxID=2642155 RepID=UPI001DDEBCA0|nr:MULTISPECIES: hypothetical protein [unclassified Microcoleus]MCC3420819.1 hypothetical protein [Microcoleus sp. PH2017_07_MST_O_A]MCC3431898.1 hypothetical protein [Microcoleus sp. PH2017_04_SCI_O_A]MCC3440776.1 hypothetical protein [Microcoleus sp. PH2017_03_ELD_O_A]MCC3506947.1 hypothetical protein [Microcoleus sp. PH2017_19_SFW_U_A]MCC3512771.1 hypothetical protein [Microcoleus sp. PH2017_17_BER_D_A]
MRSLFWHNTDPTGTGRKNSATLFLAFPRGNPSRSPPMFHLQPMTIVGKPFILVGG